MQTPVKAYKPELFCCNCRAKVRHVRSSGKVLPRCIECERQYHRDRRHRLSAGTWVGRTVTQAPTPAEPQVGDGLFGLMAEMTLITAKCRELVAAGVVRQMRVAVELPDGTRVTFGTSDSR